MVLSSHISSSAATTARARGRSRWTGRVSECVGGMPARPGRARGDVARLGARPKCCGADAVGAAGTGVALLLPPETAVA
eukprot:14355247-Alexandrium_andersonii.AAC.1